MKPEQKILEQLDQIVTEHLEKKTEVIVCPECKKEFWKDYEVSYIKQCGMCLRCDKMYTDVHDEQRNVEEDMYEGSFAELAYN